MNSICGGEEVMKAVKVLNKLWEHGGIASDIVDNIGEKN
jgi:hypothetical protein